MEAVVDEGVSNHTAAHDQTDCCCHCSERSNRPAEPTGPSFRDSRSISSSNSSSNSSSISGRWCFWSVSRLERADLRRSARKLWSGRQSGHDARLELGRWRNWIDCQSKQHSRFDQFGHLVSELLRRAQLSLEFGSFVVVERVEGIAAGQAAQVFTHGHDATPSSSRSRIIPSRSRVFTVPIGTLSIAETSLWLYPP